MNKCTKFLSRLSSYLMKETLSDTQGVLSLGVCPTMLDSLEHLSIRQIQQISEKASHYLTVTIDNKALGEAINATKAHDEHEAIIDEFLDHDASFTMMNELFGLSTQEFSNRRKKLGKKGDGQFRPKNLTPDEEHQIWAVWESHSKLCEAQRYLQVTHETGIALKRVWRHIKSLNLSG